MTASRLVLAWSLAAVVLYACALPLWEGWDEPFHYGYVESIAVQHEIPLLGKSTLSLEISQSLLRTPLPGFLAQAVPGSTSFAEWHALPPLRQNELRSSLQDLSISTRLSRGPNPNYEAQQAPLAYLLLSFLDVLFSGMHLLPRILLLRVLVAIPSILFLFAGVARLANALGVPEPFRSTLLFCSLSGQVLWASIAHVGNDAFAIPLTVWFLVALAEARTMVVLAVLLAAGVLTKAYFLCFVPSFVFFLYGSARRASQSRKQAAIALAILFGLAGPWYARNLVHGSFSGTQESAGGVTLAKALAAMPHISWWRAALAFLRNTVWLGNWSHSSFPRAPVTALLVLCAVAWIGYAANWKLIRTAECRLWFAIGCFVLGLLYQTCVTWVHTGGQTLAVEPWYWQGIVLALWTLLFLGFARSRRIATFLAPACTLLCAYIAASTFVTMLLPDYGAGLAKAPLLAKLHWWQTTAASDLTRVTPAPVNVVLILLGTFLALLLFVVCVLALDWKAAWRKQELG